MKNIAMSKLINKVKSAMNSLAFNNKGASLVTVLITMFFLTSISVTILSMSYTGVLIKQTQAKGTQTYYAADEIMNLLKASFHEVASDSVSAAYEKSLINYNSQTFNAAIADSVIDWTLPASLPTNPDVIPLVAQTAINKYSYNTNIFKYFLMQAGVDESSIYIVGDTSGDENAPIHISGGIVNEGTAPSLFNTGEVAIDDEKISFKGITITYTNANSGFKTQITSDIVINIPDYFSNNAAGVYLDFSSAQEYAIIATESLQINGDVTDASVYANSIDLNTISGANISGTYITPTDLIISDRNVTLNESSELWANSIVLNGNASLTSQANSNIYIADDLKLNGDGSSAVISGNLYGFGNSVDNAKESSTIVVNGQNTTLNLENIQRLMLAGNSFVLPLSDEQGSGILMGESISVRPNQMAYLAPLSILNTEPKIETNPHVMSVDAALPTLHYSETDTILTVNGVNKSLSSYGAKVVAMSYPLPFAPTNRAVYYFLEFDSVQNANAYFKDYFTVNSNSMSDYLTLYTNFNTIGGSSQTSGNIIEQANGAYTLPEINEVNEQSALYMQNAYSNVCKTLENTNSSSQNPYEFIVDKIAVRDFINNNGLQATQVIEFKDAADEVVAILVNSDATTTEYVLDDSYSNLKLVISTGDLTIKNNFTGLILCDGELTVATTAKISANPQGVQGAYSATHGEALFSSLLTAQGNFAVSGEENTMSEMDINDYVVFENWNKQ